MRYFSHNFIMLYVAFDLSVAFWLATQSNSIIHQLCNSKNYKNSSIEGSWETALQQLDETYAKRLQYQHKR